MTFKVDTDRILRILIVMFVFMGCLPLHGMQGREASQFIYMLGTMVLFSLILENIWISLFLCWSVFLFSYYKFITGHSYLMNIFQGCLLYYVVKKVFRREHIRFYVYGLLVFALINLLYSIVQVTGHDFLFASEVTPVLSAENIKNFSTLRGPMVQNLHPSGFLGNDATAGHLYALCVPLLAIYNLWLAPIFLLPLIATKGTINIFAGVVMYLFVLFHRISDKLFSFICATLIICGILFYVYVDRPDTGRFSQWSYTFKDAMTRPFVGWGLDSFRQSDLLHKNFTYGIPQEAARINGKTYAVGAVWDNPHNLLLSLFFEFGLPGLLILGGYFHFLYRRYKQSIKSYEVIGLAGFMLGVFIISLAWFPMFLARFVILIIPVFAMFEKITGAEEG